MHEIRYITFGARATPKGIQKECDKIAKLDGEYHHVCDPLRFFPDVVCQSYQDAVEWIGTKDNGWYDCLAVKFRENRKTYWLAKIEYHV